MTETQVLTLPQGFLFSHGARITLHGIRPEQYCPSWVILFLQSKGIYHLDDCFVWKLLQGNDINSEGGISWIQVIQKGDSFICTVCTCYIVNCGQLL